MTYTARNSKLSIIHASEGIEHIFQLPGYGKKTVSTVVCVRSQELPKSDIETSQHSFRDLRSFLPANRRHFSSSQAKGTCGSFVLWLLL